MKDRNIVKSMPEPDDFITPPEFYEKLNKKYNFDFDPCPYKHDLSKWDGLKVKWGKMNYVNPPYSSKLKEAFVIKAIEESKKGNRSVILLPVSTSTKLFHELVLPNQTGIEFIKGRLSFIGKNSKGQYLNWHLIQEIDPNEEILVYMGYDENEERDIWERKPKYTKGKGMHDSMLVLF